MDAQGRTGDLERESAVEPDAEWPTRRRRNRRRVRFTLKLLALFAVVYFFVLPLIPGFRKAATELGQVNPVLLAGGLVLELAALFSYSLLTRTALGDSGALVSPWRMFRIQMSTKALSSVVPGGSAAGSALGFRLMTLSGVPGPDAGFALGTAGLVSALVLNALLWLGLIVSIPVRGVNPLYATAAIIGIVFMMAAGTLVIGLMEGKGRAERALRWVARKLRLDEQRAASGLNQIGDRLEELTEDRQLLRRVIALATANWLLDAAALWVFLRAFGETPAADGLIVAFGLANVLAVIPITPGGLGIVEGVYIPTLIGFGLTRSTATLGVASYRIAQLWLPILLGGILYLSLRAGPWSILRRMRLQRLRDLAKQETERRESALDFAVRHGSRRDGTGGARSRVTSAGDSRDGSERDLDRDVDHQAGPG